MNKLPSTWKYDVMFGLLMLAMVALAVRMAFLLSDGRIQGLKLTQTQETRTIKLPGRPGSIYTISNNIPVPLALSRQIQSCFIDPSRVQEQEIGDVAVTIAGALNVEPKDVQNLILSRRHDKFVWLKRDIQPAEVDAISAMKYPSIGVLPEWKREYPNGDLASTVLGWCQDDGKGGGGIELSQYDVLAAHDGKHVVQVSASKQPVALVPEASSPPRDGSNVFLTIDANIQQFLYDAVSTAADKSRAKWAVGMVVDPNTGEILAMTSVYLDPRTKQIVVFDPNDFNAVAPEARQNYCVSVPYEPGSAAKTIYAAAAVDAGVMDWDSKIFCENGIYSSPRGGVISDHGAHYGLISLREIIAFSSNIGMGKVGEKCGNKLLYEIGQKFGFGSRTGIELKGESSGIVRRLAGWDGYSTLRVPFGQEISVTAVQLAMAYCALANGGELLKPHLINRIVDATGKETYHWQRQALRRVLKPATSAQALSAMQGVVEIDGGTGKLCRSQLYTTFGKTGTAQISSTDRKLTGYVDGAFTATFVGGAPVKNPRIICLISVHWPTVGSHYGANVAGPYFKEVIEKTLTYLNVPPDKAQPDSAAPAGPPAR
jgi:cell division protein FtsI/penicillin-binding protein 2